MKIIDTKIPDVKILESEVFGDDRGFFMEVWRQDRFSELVCPRDFVQENHSKSSKHTLRGMHYQTKNTQGKLVRVVSGSVFDVAVDMRRSSPTFGKWTGAVLSSENKQQMWIPEGFAHGFYVLSDCAEFVYKCTDYYNPEYEHSLLWNDPVLNISWPIESGFSPLLSKKDIEGKSFSSSVYFDC